jgi:hypothetical protein
MVRSLKDTSEDSALRGNSTKNTVRVVWFFFFDLVGKTEEVGVAGFLNEFKLASYIICTRMRTF